MQYRDLGRTGMKVSALGFGAMRLPNDEQEGIRIIQRALDLGVNYVDTAHAYGVTDNRELKSETVVGKAVKGRRDQIFLSSKLGVSDASGENYRAGLEESLRRMDIDYIDLYHMHGLTWEAYQGCAIAPGGPLEVLQKAKEQGLVRHIVFSCHDTPENMIKLIDTGNFESMLVQYNLLDRKNEPAIAHAHEKGMGVAIMGPVGGGRLATPSESIQRMIPGGVASTPELALRFVLANPNVSVALSGMNAISQVEENVATASRADPLTAQERKRLEKSLAETEKLKELYCTGCEYCMPCAHGVNIPKNLGLLILSKVWGLTDYARQQYRSLPEPERAAMCQQCEECLEKCPQKLNIPEQLEEAVKILGEE